MSTADDQNVTGAVVPFRNTVKLLDVTLDSDLTMDRHVAGVLRSYIYYMYHALCHIRPLLTLNVAKMITHSVVSSRLDYANTLLHGTSATNLNKLQVAQNTVARVMCQAPRSVSVMHTTTLVSEQHKTELSLHIRREPTALCLPLLSDFGTTNQNGHYDLLINCF